MAFPSGAIAMNDGLLRTLLTETWKETVQPVGILAGSWKLI